MAKKYILVVLAFVLPAFLSAQSWPEVKPEAKPGTRWWWMGSAVDSVNLTRNMEMYAKAGIGAVEITPIYGVKGNEANDIEFLSPRWMRMLGHTIAEGNRLGIEVDMNTGTGWPFGGPLVSTEEAATKATFAGDSLVVGKTRQMVKRAAPGGVGFVLDHFNRQAVEHYLERFDKAFEESGVPYPHTFFNDSYEVYGADWTPNLLNEFEQRRGYRLDDNYAAFNDEKHPDHSRVIHDYRETLSDLLLENFTATWRDWAHQHGAKVRNQAHGSPANLLDVYASVDIPEIEGYGLSDFGINGLRTDTLTRKNDSDLSMLKYPASVAHFYGKPFVSAETFTWLTEHFRTSLSQCKPDFDLMMVAGVNHIYFHGTTYSPQEAAWPGHLFYASMEMSPINTIWRDAPAFFQYITRVQSWMQYGEPDNDLLVYLPVHDIWSNYPGRLLQFDIHSMAQKAPDFIRTVNSLYDLGYDMDYCSDRMLNDIVGVNEAGDMVAPSGVTYKSLVVPATVLPAATMARIEELKQQGAHIVMLHHPAESAVAALSENARIRPEMMRIQHLKCIRRKNAEGYHYFISNLRDHDFRGWLPLGVKLEEAWHFNPLTGEVSKLDNTPTGVWLNLQSGESAIVLARNEGTSRYHLINNRKTQEIDLTKNKWQLKPVEMQSWGDLPEEVAMKGLQPWTALDTCWQTAKGTASYTTTVNLSSRQLRRCQDWELVLGDVRESAHVYVNGHDAGIAFSVPFRLNIGKYLQPGKNTICIEVTNLAANYVSEMDRRGQVWRIFKDANIANLKGGKVSYYGNWDILPSGLNSTVKLVGK